MDQVAGTKIRIARRANRGIVVPEKNEAECWAGRPPVSRHRSATFKPNLLRPGGMRCPPPVNALQRCRCAIGDLGVDRLPVTTNWVEAPIRLVAIESTNLFSSCRQRDVQQFKSIQTRHSPLRSSACTHSVSARRLPSAVEQVMVDHSLKSRTCGQYALAQNSSRHKWSFWTIRQFG